MKITQQVSTVATPRILTASRDYLLKLKMADIYFASAIVTDDMTVEAARGIFDEVSKLEIPKSNGALKQQEALLVAAGVATSVKTPEEPGDDTPEWKPSEFVKVEQVRKYGDTFYRVLQRHVTQADWMPPAVPALWKKIETVGDGAPPAWSAPTGAHNSYVIGERVTHNGKTYESLIPANTTEPGSDPRWWEEIID